MLISPLLLVSKLGMSGSIPPLFPYAFKAWAQITLSFVGLQISIIQYNINTVLLLLLLLI
jgi:hypothetical protein